MKKKILADFQICISVPLMFSSTQMTQFAVLQRDCKETIDCKK